MSFLHKTTVRNKGFHCCCGTNNLTVAFKVPTLPLLKNPNIEILRSQDLQQWLWLSHQGPAVTCFSVDRSIRFSGKAADCYLPNGSRISHYASLALCSAAVFFSYFMNFASKYANKQQPTSRLFRDCTMFGCYIEGIIRLLIAGLQ